MGGVPTAICLVVYCYYSESYGSWNSRNMDNTYDAYEVEEFNERRVEKVVLVWVSDERLDDRPEQIKPCDVSVIELIFEADTLAQ